MASVNVDIDIDDILLDMGTSEKEELCQQLIEDGYGPELDLTIDVDLKYVFNPGTYTEHELVRLFEDLWENRIHIDHKLVDELRANLKEQNIL
mgnify:FL=1